MESLESFNIELKKAEDYLDAMVRAKTADKEDCENVKMLLENINTIVRSLSKPDVSNFILIAKRNYKAKDGTIKRGVEIEGEYYAPKK